MMTHPLPVAAKLPIRTLVARKLPIHTEHTHTGVYLSLKGVVYANNSVIPITEIGETSNTRLQCITDKMPCCGKPNKFGEWLLPGGANVPIKASGKPFYRNRGNYGKINLNLRNVTTDNVMIRTGLFCCVVPDANGDMQTVCANICELEVDFVQQL